MKTRFFFLAALLSTALFYGLWWKSPLLEDLDGRIYDLLSAAEPKVPASGATVVVEIDEKSLEALGQWPWPRVVMAELLKRIASMNPSSVVIDMVFPEPDRTSPAALGRFYRDFFHLDVALSGLPETLSDNDRLFAEAVGSVNTTVALFFDPAGSGGGECFLPASSAIGPAGKFEGLYASPHLRCNIPMVQHAARAAGHIQASPDRDGIFRRLPLFIRSGDVLIPSLGLGAAASLDPKITLSQERWSPDITVEALGHTLRTDRLSNVLLRFYPSQWYRTVSALDVLRGEADPALFQGKIVLVGATAMGLHDRYTLSDGTMRPGVFAHATLIENLFDNTLILQPSLYAAIAFFLSMAVAAVLMILMFAKKYLHVLGLFAFAGTAGMGAGYAMMARSTYISVGYFLIPLASYLFVLAIVLFVIHYRAQKRFFEKMSKANEAMIDSMALVAETRDTETGAHIIRTKEYVRSLAEYLAQRRMYPDILTPEYITNLYHAAPLHDVGKVGISDEILKKNAKLTFDEFEVMKTHTTLGQEIIGNAIHTYKNTEMLEIAYNIALGHHEKWDGTGYPNGLRGEQIPLEARMMALADVYDALISRRRYKEPFSYADAEEIITEGRGKHFDPALVDAFVAIKEEFRTIAENTARRTAP